MKASNLVRTADGVGRWPPFLLASHSALQREIWGVELPAAPAAGASEGAAGEGFKLGPGNVDQSICCECLCVPCRATGVTGPFLLWCLLRLYGKSHLLSHKKIDQYMSAAFLSKAAF